MKRLTGFLLPILILFPMSLYADQWIQRPGLAKDIGVGADGSVWVIGTNPVGTAQDFGIYKWVLTERTWEGIDGGGVRIDVDENGNPWVVNSRNQIFRRINNQWEQLPGLAKDIGIGTDGSVWVIGTNPVGVAQDFGIYRWTGSTWETIDGGGVRIDADENGNPWVVNSRNQIFRRVNNQWTQLPGLAKDIGIGASGAIWVIGTNPIGAAHDFGIYRWTGSSWESIDGGGVQISVDRIPPLPWVVNSMGQIFQRVPVK